MLRIVGAMMLITGAAALGIGAVKRLDGRVQELRRLTAGVAVMNRELSWRIAPLPELLGRAAEETSGQARQFFLTCAQEAESLAGRAFHKVWKEALAKNKMYLEPADMEILEQLGGVLGRYDGESQTQALQGASIQLKEQLRQAEERRERLGKVYGVLGLTAGLFLTILFI